MRRSTMTPGRRAGWDLPDLASRFRRDESGSYLIVMGLVMPMLVGMVGLGTDAGLWLYKHRAMQSAADSSSFSAAAAYINDVRDKSGLEAQAKAVSGSYGYVHGSNGVTVTVNWPHPAGAGAVEVIVEQPQTPLFAGLFLKDLTVGARAVALATQAVAGTGCVLALNGSAAAAISAQGSSEVVLDGCSLASNSSSRSALSIGGSATIKALSVGVVGGVSGSTSKIITPSGGIATGLNPTSDPYKNASFPPVPARCDQTGFEAKSTVTLTPQYRTEDPAAPVPPLYVLCGGMTLNGGAHVTLAPGIYYLVESAGGTLGNLTINGGATLQGDGVTLVFTSRNGSKFGAAKINGGAVVKLAAPKEGPSAGLVIFGDRNMTGSPAFEFNGGATQVFDGAIYLPKAAVTFAGGARTSDACTQLVADTIKFAGNADFKIGCPNGMKQIGSIPASIKLIK